MDTLESVGKRIATTSNLKSIVRTMKSLSAVSIRQYEQAAESLRLYSETIELGLHVVLRRRAMPQSVSDPPGDDAVVIVFGSDYGLCGRFNEQITHFARSETAYYGTGGRRRLWLPIGARTSALLEAAGEPVDTCYFLPGAVSGMTTTAHSILLKVDEWRETHGIERVFLAHNRRENGAASVPQLVRLLPLDTSWLDRLMQRRWPSRRLPTFTMNDADLFSFLIQQHLFVAIFRAGVDSLSSEHATRLASMQAAERNIDETLDELNAAYRRKRQETITEELMDVVTGYETLMAG